MRQYSSQDQATAAASVAQELGGLVFGPSYIESSRFYTVVTRHEIEDNYKPYLEQMQNSFTYY